jgi:YggT family protein
MRRAAAAPSWAKSWGRTEVLAQIATFLVNTLVTFFVVLLLARFHLQWLRVPFRNPVGEFLIATTNWMVMPVRRVVPPIAGLDTATFLLAWLLEFAGLWLLAAIGGIPLTVLGAIALALVELLRFSLYILVFAIVMQVVFSWVNPSAPLAPVFDAIARPFLRPLRRFIPPIGRVDLTPAVLFIFLQLVLEFVLPYLKAMAALL